MYRKRISRLTYIILAFLLLVMGCGSLMATYTYDAGTVSPISTSYEAQLAKWDYTPEQIRKILEGLNTSDSTLNKDIATLLKDEDSNSFSSFLEFLKWIFKRLFGGADSQIINNTSIGSMDSNTTIRADMKELTVDGLSWIFYFPNGMDQTCYLYITESDLSAYQIDVDWVPNVYRTIIKKNADGTYQAGESVLGYAKSIYFPRHGSNESSTVPAFDVTDWHKGTPPDSTAP